MVFGVGDDIPGAGEALTQLQWSLRKDGIAREQKGKAAAALACVHLNQPLLATPPEYIANKPNEGASEDHWLI
jgi:hypothetical protein